MKSGKVYVKISGAYRLSNKGPDYPDAVPFAKTLIAANPTAWAGVRIGRIDSVTPPGKKPTDLTPLYQIDDGRLFNQLAVWAPGRRDPQEDPGRQSRQALRL